MPHSKLGKAKRVGALENILQQLFKSAEGVLRVAHMGSVGPW